jgi:transposase
VAEELGAGLLAGSSLKAALDQDWDDPAARATALGTLLDLLETVTAALRDAELLASAPVAAALAIAGQVRDQDVVSDDTGQPQLRHGVAPDRRISVADGAMRHGRKSRAQRVDGYKRHVLHDLDQGLIRAVGITPANVPEAQVTDPLWADLAQQQATVTELHIDRAYLSSAVVRDRPADLTIFCKAWPVRNGSRFPKTAFQLDWDRGRLRCPNGVEVPFAVGQTVHFPAATCAACPLRAQCTSSAHGRSVTIHPDERLLVELRERQATPAGRAKLRERVAVEHTLAHVGRWQGRRARYRGERKNVFDLRRAAVVHNLHVLQRAA